MKNTPSNIASLEPHQIFVFGSNTAGVHGKGAALTAQNKFGAKRGVAEGITGQCYAIPTREYFRRPFGKSLFRTLELREIAIHVGTFMAYAQLHPEKEFLVTLIGCGYAGYSPDEIKSMFQLAPPNVILPIEFTS